MTEFTTPQTERTITGPEQFGINRVITIGGEQVAANQTEDELRAVANDPEQGRLGRVTDTITGEEKPVLIAGEGVLVADKQPVTIYMDENLQLGYMLSSVRTEATRPEQETTVNAPTAIRRGKGLLAALRAKLTITSREEAFGVDPSAVSSGPSYLTKIDMSGANQHQRVQILPDHRNS